MDLTNMTQQTLRESYEKEVKECYHEEVREGKAMVERDEAFNLLLARFKEFTEKVIGKDEKHQDYCSFSSEESCDCQADDRNALRNEQREKLLEFFN